MLPALLYFRHDIFMLFVHHEEIVDLILPLTGIYAVMLISDYLHEVELGILLAMGYQKYATWVNLLGYWLIGIPFAIGGYYFGYKLVGIWAGVGLGSASVAVLFSILIYLADWDAI